MLWDNMQQLPSHQYTCGYCGNSIASEKGWQGRVRLTSGGQKNAGSIYICHKCERPTFFDINARQTPGTPFGSSVKDVTEKSVNDLFEEARRAMSNGSYTAVVLCCRKLLMHIAVSKGATQGEPFINYVQYLSDKNFIPPDARYWVDHIRTKSNEANHEIVIMTKDDAEDLLSFIEMLLKVMFEFPAAVKRKQAVA